MMSRKLGVSAACHPCVFWVFANEGKVWETIQTATANEYEAAW